MSCMAQDGTDDGTHASRHGHDALAAQLGNDRGDVFQFDLADGFLPMAGRMRLLSASLNPEIDLVTSSAD